MTRMFLLGYCIWIISQYFTLKEQNAEILKVHVVDWLKINKLSLNLKKTHFIIFRKPRQKINLENELSIDNVKIEMKTHTKFLGVLVGQHLTFEEHCKFIKGKISRGIGILYKGKNISVRNRYSICTMLSYILILHIILVCGPIHFHIYSIHLWNYRRKLYALLMGGQVWSYGADLWKVWAVKP